jgi:hypothetical protein
MGRARDESLRGASADARPGGAHRRLRPVALVGLAFGGLAVVAILVRSACLGPPVGTASGRVMPSTVASMVIDAGTAADSRDAEASSAIFAELAVALGDASRPHEATRGLDGRLRDRVTAPRPPSEVPANAPSDGARPTIPTSVTSTAHGDAEAPRTESAPAPTRGRKKRVLDREDP